MSLKFIQFTDGTKIPIFPRNNVYDGRIPFTVDVGQNGVLTNGMLAVGITGGFLNANGINGKVLTDKDGNRWTFILQSATTIRLTITSPNGSITSTTLSNQYSAGSQWGHFLVVTAIDENGNHSISVASIRPSSLRSTGTTSGKKYIYGIYQNGVSGNYDFNTDLSNEHDYPCVVLSNRSPGNGFIDIISYYKWGFNNEYASPETFYFGMASAGTTGSTLVILSENSITETGETPADPYDPGGGSGTGGGTGNFDGTGDDIDIPGLPTLSATDTGFITLFNPSTGQLQALANYMWSSGFDLDTFKKLFADPMDCILGLSIVPVAVPNGGSKAVSVGNISTGVSMTVAASQYVEVDCGTLNVNEYWGAYLDYDPYTKAEIYLPYIGTHPVAVDDIMGKAVRVVYHIDILSGACTAFVKCGGSVLYEFIGQCSSSIPITGNDWTNVINGVLTVAGAIGSMVATGGASAPMAAGVIAATATNSMKPNVEKSGSMSGTGGMLAVQTPYLILTRPRQALPSGQNSFMGYPSFITESLGSLSGYTEIESVHLEGINATEQELSEIESLLKSGVIF